MIVIIYILSPLTICLLGISLLLIIKKIRKKRKYIIIETDDVQLSYIKSNKCFNCLTRVPEDSKFYIDEYLFCYICYRKDIRNFSTISF